MAVVIQKKVESVIVEPARFSTIDLRQSAPEEQKLFFGAGHGISRYDIVRYPELLKLNEKMQGQFWRPVEVDMSQEKNSFLKMSDTEQFIFTSNLRRQILLDTVQGRAPSLTFLPHCTDSVLENCILTWSFFESIHSESYTHIIRAIYPDPSFVFDEIPKIVQIADCAKTISASYDAMINNPNKENLYLALVTANALEAIRFFVSFACTFSFAERGFVEGSAKSVRYIARDEIQHLILVQKILKILAKDDPEFVQIIGDNASLANKIFDETIDQERTWIDYLTQYGSALGISKSDLNQYLDYLAPRRKAAAGLSTKGTHRVENPFLWINKWLTAEAVQVALQEVEAPDYLVGTLENNLSGMSFEGFSL